MNELINIKAKIRIMFNTFIYSNTFIQQATHLQQRLKQTRYYL